jgi:hypothetical protein
MSTLAGLLSFGLTAAVVIGLRLAGARPPLGPGVAFRRTGPAPGGETYAG